MRGTLLPTLRSMLRAEIGETSSTSIATQKDASVNTLFSNAQKLYSTLRDWPFLERKWDAAVAAGTRYVAFPTADIRGTAAVINTERPFFASVFFDRLYIPLDYGIGDQEFEHRNSDLLEKEDPVQRWDYATNAAETANADQFEVWPIPVTAQTVRFTGQRQPYVLSAETDKADLDDMLLVYTVGAQLLARLDDRTAEAQLMSSKAQSRLNFLTGAYPNRTEPLILGRNTCPRPNRRDIKLVAIAGSQ